MDLNLIEVCVKSERTDVVFFNMCMNKLRRVDLFVTSQQKAAMWKSRVDELRYSSRK